MKKYFACICVCFFFLLVPVKPGYSQIPILDIIREGITKVIVAVDLKIQRLQNETIWLQKAQKVLENEMSKLKLDEISDWVTRQRELYALYFDELRRVKTVLSYYHKIKEIFAQQVQMVKEYKAAWALFQQDKNFTAGELQYMYRVYSGIFGESVKNINQLELVIQSFATQMTDGERLEMIQSVAESIGQQHADLREFNHQNKIISLQRAVERGEIEYVKKLYGL